MKKRGRNLYKDPQDLCFVNFRVFASFVEACRFAETLGDRLIRGDDGSMVEEMVGISNESHSNCWAVRGGKRRHEMKTPFHRMYAQIKEKYPDLENRLR